MRPLISLFAFQCSDGLFSAAENISIPSLEAAAESLDSEISSSIGHIFCGPPSVEMLPLSLSPVLMKRKIKGNLNKLTVDRFVLIAEKIAQLIEQCTNVDQVESFADLIVETALAEQQFAEMYSDLLLVRISLQVEVRLE